jgi:hypothetical protein
MVEYEDYIIRMKELDRPPEPKKKISRLKSFLGELLEKPLVLDFSRDAKSSFVQMPGYRRSYHPEKK